MVSQVIYRTEAGDILAAKTDADTNHTPNNQGQDQADVKIIRTVGGLDLLVATVVGKVGRDHADPDPDWVNRAKKATFIAIEASTLIDVPEILIEAIRVSNQAIVANPSLRGTGLTQVIVAIHGQKLYLAQVGNCRAYLIRGGKAVQLTYDHTLAGELMRLGKTLPAEISASPRKNELVRYIGKDNNIYVDTRINYPGAAPKNALQVLPGDGVILCNNETIERVILRGQLDDTGESFLSFYDRQSAATIAEKLTEAANHNEPGIHHPVVVVKPDQEFITQPVPVQHRSWLGQFGILAAVLILSLSLGLAAAYAFPALMNPKPVPNTGSVLAQPGFILVALADGKITVQSPDKSQTSLGTGDMIEGKSGTLFRTDTGTAKLVFADGTAIYVDRSSTIVVQEVANTKANRMNNVIQVLNGSVMVDASQAAAGVTTQVTSTEEGEIYARGPAMGTQFDSQKNDFEIDCLKGPCLIANTSASQDLATGQHSSIVQGTIGNTSDVNWDRWNALCGPDCSVPLLVSAPPTPTFVPTPVPGPATPVPYLGAYQEANPNGGKSMESSADKIAAASLFPWALFIFGGLQVGLAGIKGMKSIRGNNKKE